MKCECHETLKNGAHMDWPRSQSKDFIKDEIPGRRSKSTEHRQESNSIYSCFETFHQEASKHSGGAGRKLSSQNYNNCR